MTAEYDAINERAVLAGDGLGWQRMRQAMPVAPANTTQAIYVMTVETPETALSDSDTGVAWNCAGYYGFKFDNTFPSSSAESNSDYDNFFGPRASDNAQTDRWNYLMLNRFGNYYGLLKATGFGASMSDGNGSNIIDNITLSDEENAGLAFAGGAHQPNVAALIWRVHTSFVDDSVHYEFWRSVTGPDLSTFDIANDMDPQDPEATFPVLSGSFLSGTIQGDVTSTNWRPTTGVMAFPTYFMACHPANVLELRIPYVGVQYSVLDT